MKKLLEIIKTNLLTCNWGNQSGDIFSFCRRPVVSPHWAQGPPSLLSVPGHCSPAPIPNGLSCLTEGSSHREQAQVGSRSQNMPFKFQGSLITITSSWPNVQFSDPRVSNTGCEMLLGSVLLAAVKFQRHQVLTFSAEQSLLKRRPWTIWESDTSLILFKNLLWPSHDDSGTILLTHSTWESPEQQNSKIPLRLPLAWA